MRLLATSTLLSTIALLPFTSAFYIPGWSIRSYADSDPIPLSTNKLTSPFTQLPYAYSEQSFVCPALPDGFGAKFGSSRSVGLNLGEVLRGDRISISDYELYMGQDETCGRLCDRKIGRSEIWRAKLLVEQGYVVEWIVDNLPGATSFVTVDKSRKYYAAGFKLGFVEDEKTYIHNHVTFVLRWRKAPNHPDKKVIVAFEVYTKSIAEPGGKDDCAEALDAGLPGLELALPEDLDAEMTIPYTYAVYWKEDNDIEWSNRWDLYFVNDEESAHVHWLAIVNSLVIAMLLTIVVAIVMLRTLSRDIQNYNEGGPASAVDAEAKREVEEEDDVTGWKLVHADVFRPPPMGGLFAPLIGSGVQLMIVLTALLILSATGILNPSYRGGFISFSIFLFVFAGVFSGYFSSRVYKTFHGDNWRKNALMTSLIFPGFVFASVFILNLFVWSAASSTAIPFTTLLALLALWLFVSTPLVFLGSFLGFSRPPSTPPTHVSQIPRQTPHIPWYLQPLPCALLSGLLPFAVLFIELLFVFKSLWQDKSSYYYVPGFLALSLTSVAVTTIEVSVVTTYLLLNAEDHRWWWRAFGAGAGSALWVWAYSVWYFFTKLKVRGVVSALLFFAYSAVGCVGYAVLVGTLGVLGSWVFVRRIYGAIKAD